MSGEETIKKFELVFEGPIDDSVRTLQRLKGAFISDLEFPVDEVQRILKEAPLTIYSTEAETEAESRFEILKKAGAKVLLIRPAGKESEESKESSEPPGEAIFDLGDLSDDLPTEKTIKKSAPKVYKLDIDDVLFNTPPTDEPEEGESTPDPDKLVKSGGVLEPLPSLDLLTEDLSDPAPTRKETTQNPPELTASDTELQFVLDEPKEIAPQKSTPTTVAPQSEKKAEPPKSIETDSSLSLLELDVAPAAPTPPKKSEPAPSHPIPPPSLDSGLKLDEPDPPPPPVQPEKKEPVKVVSSVPSLKDIQGNITSPPAISKLDANNLGILDVEEPEEEIEEVAEKTVAAAPPPQAAAEQPVEQQPETSLREAFARKKKAPRPEDTATTDDSNAGAPTGAEEEEGEEKSIFRDIVAPLVLGLAVLLVANWGYWNYLASDSSSEGISVSPELLRQQLASVGDGDAEKTGAKVSKTPPPIPVKFLGSETTPRQVKSTFSLLLGATSVEVRQANITLEIPSPPELTPEEIVAQKKRAPWVYKIEVDGVNFTAKENNTIEGTGVAKFYLDHLGSRTRGVGAAYFRGTLSAGKSYIEGDLKTYAGYDSPPDIEIAPSLTDAGKLKFSFSQTIRADKP